MIKHWDTIYPDETVPTPEQNNDQLVPEWLYRQPIVSSHFDSYNRWLQSRHPDVWAENPNTPPQPIDPIMQFGYRVWRNMTPEERIKYPLTPHILSGEFAIYRRVPSEEGHLRVHGPLGFDESYQGLEDYGPMFYRPFERVDKFITLLAEFGYELVRPIAQGDPDEPFDHQVWLVRELTTNNTYAMKIVSANYFYHAGFRTACKMISKMESETQVMKLLDHPNIVRIVKIFGVREPITDFPYVFIATVMEQMTGNTFALAKKDYPDSKFSFRVPNHVASDILVQMSKAVDYLHNHVQGFVVVHQAIKPENILFTKTPGHDPRARYKLVDFEECISYDKSGLQPGMPFDFLPNPEEEVYLTFWSSPQYWNVRDRESDPHTLRTMPNDIYCLATSVLYLRGGVDQWQEMERTNFLITHLHRRNHWENPIDELLRLMTIYNPQQRISAHDLVNHPLFIHLELTALNYQ